MRVAACVVLVVVLLFGLMAGRDLAVSPDEEIKCASWACDFYVTARDFQTLLGSALALAAAAVAARPVWLQLKSMTLQQEITARAVVARRLYRLEHRSDSTTQRVSKYVSGINLTIFTPDHHDDLHDYNSSAATAHWSFDAAQEARKISSELLADQVTRQDTDTVERSRITLIGRLDSLADCLSAISAPAEYAGTPEVSEEMELDMEDAAAKALDALPDHVSAVERAYADLRFAFMDEIERLRRRIRKIDDALL